MAEECGAQTKVLAFDAFGGWSITTSAFFDKINTAAKDHPEAGRAFQWIKQAISVHVAIHRWNGRALQEACNYHLLFHERRRVK